MIDGMFQAGIDKSLDDQQQRPRAAPLAAGPGFFAGFGTMPHRVVGAAAAEGVAFGAEITGAFGQVLGAYPEAMGPVQLSPEQRKQAEEARRKLLDKGLDFSNEAGDIFRERTRELMPNPETTGQATQIVASFLRYGAKSAGYIMTTGPFAPALIGADEGLTEADRLKREGVDLATRTKAGAVAGGIAGVSMVVPMTGATAATRFVKGAGAGVAGVAGQSAAEKAILKAAGYDKIADTFDPLDPVALALGVVPGALGAKFGRPAAKPVAPGAVKPLAEMGLGERQALRYDDTRLDAYAVQAAQREGIPPEVLLAVKNAGEKSGPTAASPKGARGVMQFMPETYREVGRGDPLDPINSIDAGAKYLKKLHAAYGDWDAAVAHYNGGGSQAALVRSGARPSFKETAAYLDRVKAYMGKTVDDNVAATVRANPELVDAVRVNLASAAIDNSRLTPDLDLPGRDAHVSAVEMAMTQLARGEPVRVAHTVDLPSRRFEAVALTDAAGMPLSGLRMEFENGRGGRGSLELGIEGDRMFVSRLDSGVAGEPHGIADHQVRELYQAAIDEAEARGLSFTSGRTVAPEAARVFDSLRERGYDVRENPTARAATVLESAARHVVADDGAPAFKVSRARGPRQAAAGLQEIRAAMATRDPSSIAGAPGLTGARGADEVMPVRASAGTSAARVVDEAMSRHADAIAMGHPDLLIQLEGMDAPVRASELLAAVRKEAAQLSEDAKLIEVAARCAISF